VLNGLKRIVDCEDEMARDSLLCLSSKSIFINEGGKLAIGICPFGMSREQQDAEMIRAGKSEHEEDRDNDRWKAPEILLGKVIHPSEGQIVWSVGMLFVEIVAGKIPWSGLTGTDARREIVRFQQPPEVESLKGDCLFDIINGCFNFDLKDRPNLLNLERELLARMQDKHQPIDANVVWSIRSLRSDDETCSDCHNHDNNNTNNNQIHSHTKQKKVNAGNVGEAKLSIAGTPGDMTATMASGQPHSFKQSNQDWSCEEESDESDDMFRLVHL
jgi:serine/threonine protein kinase